MPFSILYHYLVFSASISIDVTIILPCLNEEKTLLKSYDVKSIPRFITELKNGYDVIIGNRFKGKIEDGAMSLSHRIGSRFLTRYANLLFHTPINDFHCGLRAFNRKKLLDTGIKSPGFEFASEMIIRAKTNKLRLKEIETNLF